MVQYDDATWAGLTSVAAPIAGAVIAQRLVIAGSYEVTATIFVSGAVSVTDRNNVALYIGDTLFATLPFPAVLDTPITVRLPRVDVAPSADAVAQGAADGVSTPFRLVAIRKATANSVYTVFGMITKIGV